jgi:hypothetical protein
VASVSVGIIAFSVAAMGAAGLAGLSFALHWPVGWLIDRSADRQRRALAPLAPPVESQHTTAAGGGLG